MSSLNELVLILTLVLTFMSCPLRSEIRRISRTLPSDSKWKSSETQGFFLSVAVDSPQQIRIEEFKSNEHLMSDCANASKPNTNIDSHGSLELAEHYSHRQHCSSHRTNDTRKDRPLSLKHRLQAVRASHSSLHLRSALAGLLNQEMRSTSTQHTTMFSKEGTHSNA